MKRYIKILYIQCLLCILCMPLSAQDNDNIQSRLLQPVFENPDSSYTQSGSLKLSWTIKDSLLGSELILFELQQSQQKKFDSLLVRYKGSDLASYISGLAEGIYYYRVRSELDGQLSDWSEPIVVVVEHHSLQLAFLLFGLGAVVFLATVVVVVKGSKEEVV